MILRPPDIARDNPFRDDPETSDCQWLVIYFCISVSKLENTDVSGLRPSWIWALPWAHLSSGTGLLAPLNPLSAAELVSQRLMRAFSQKMEALGLSNMPPFSGLMAGEPELVDVPGAGRAVWRTFTALAEPRADPVKAGLEARAWIDDILLTSCPWAPSALELPTRHGRSSERQDTAAHTVEAARAQLERHDIERDMVQASGASRAAWGPRI